MRSAASISFNAEFDWIIAAMTKLKNSASAATPVKRKALNDKDVSPLPGPATAQALERGPGDAVYERILTSLMEHRLTPGTKLVEEKLAGIFNVSRTRIREVLARLGHEGVVVTVPNRGAFVASPTVEEARAVFGARRLVEPALVRQLCETARHARRDDIIRLKAHVEREASARLANDRRSIIRLSGEFHILIAELVGNPIMTKLMRELASLTCLIIVLYDSPSVPSCPHHEHSDIIGAIAAADADRAIDCMLGHLEYIENVLSLSDSYGAEADLEAIFR
jgi:DNA-binding GntR family transcriptional regulator